MDILGAGDLLKLEMAKEKLEDEEIAVINPHDNLSGIASHIHTHFQRNKDSRRNSGVEEEILLGNRMANKEYSPRDRLLIEEEGGTDIYMPVGATKIRALVAWVKDILLNPKEWPFSIEPTEVPELPSEAVDAIISSVTTEFEKFKADPQTTEELASNIQLQYDLKRDMQDMIISMINEEAKHSFKIHENLIRDQFQQGSWEKAFGDFIEDFAVYPAAFMKGPVLRKEMKLVWRHGIPAEEMTYVFVNIRVNPLDMFPDPSSDTLQRGHLCEVIRTRPEDLNAMKGVPGWDEDKIDLILRNHEGYGDLWTTELESERTHLERRGNTTDAHQGVHFGIHYHGAIRKDKLYEWSIDPRELSKLKNDYVEIEAIIYGSEVAKVSINDDPLKRRPYYHACFQNRSGTLWGISLPYLMDPIQRVCNSTMRALVNNMAFSARPLTIMNIERLADDGDIADLQGGDIVQITNDPHGSNQPAVSFTHVPSNAKELLEVYNAFESKADDATMIPRYAYGGQDVKGAAATASGLAMLMESASKGIKDAVRHIDTDLIIPRVKFQFYYNMKSGAIKNFSGDIDVTARGSGTLALKGAQELRRNEFLQSTANAIDQEIMGFQGRATVLRETAEGLGLSENVVPNRFTLRKQEREKKANEKAQAEAAGQGAKAGVEATKIQIDGQERMHRETQALGQAKLDFDTKKHDDLMIINQAKLDNDLMKKQEELTAGMTSDQMKHEADAHNKDKDVAVAISNR